MHRTSYRNLEDFEEREIRPLGGYGPILTFFGFLGMSAYMYVTNPQVQFVTDIFKMAANVGK